MADEIVIVSATRTAIGKFLGNFAELNAHELGAVVIKEALKRAKVSPEDVSEVILGQVLAAGKGQNPARQASINAGLPYSVPAYGINFLCGSGLQAVVDGYLHIQGGLSKIVVCGGQESMSQTTHTTFIRQGLKLGNSQLTDTLLFDGLTDAFNNCHMGATAEYVAKKYNVGREEQDRYALRSQLKAEKAISSGKFAKEIVPVTIKRGKESVDVSQDEFPRLNCTFKSLQLLGPAFMTDKIGTVTRGNVTGLNDGAAAVVLMQKSEATRRNLSPLARIVAISRVGLDPMLMGLSPIPAIKTVLENAGWSKDDVDIYEINEPYAAHACVIEKELGLNPDKLNIYGGAIALGHPLGSSGARVLVTLLSALEETGGIKGVLSLYVGGGQGIAVAIEKL